MPHGLRVLLGVLAFSIFFVGSLAIGIAIFPLIYAISFGDRRIFRRRCTRFVGTGYGTFLYCLRVWGLISWESRLSLPPELNEKPYVLVANHPSLIDVLFLLHWLPGSTCVVKDAWRNNMFFGPVLRSVDYVSTRAPGDDPFTGALDRMVKHVKKGHPLIIFPEGTRSRQDRLHRFKRGAFEVAARAGVPLVSVFIALDQPILMKGENLSLEDRGTWRFDLLSVLSADEVRATTSRALSRRVEQDFQSRFEEWKQERARLLDPHPSPRELDLRGRLLAREPHNAAGGMGLSAVARTGVSGGFKEKRTA